MVACQAFGKELRENVNNTPSSQAAQRGARHGERWRPRGEREQNNKVFKVSNITVITNDYSIFFERTADAERIYNSSNQSANTNVTIFISFRLQELLEHYWKFYRNTP